jgi:hypothetical protein
MWHREIAMILISSGILLSILIIIVSIVMEAI